MSLPSCACNHAAFRLAFVLVITMLSVLIAADARAQALLVCGSNEMFLIDAASAEKADLAKLWSWSGDDAEGLSAEERRGFNHLDECKPVAGGRKVLVSASNGGCALVERPSGRVLWRAHVTNAHSLELLPGDRVVVASSLGGDHLVLFDLARSGVPLWRTRLHSAHGVVWDESRRCLWALGFDELRRYELHDWETDKPSLTLKASYPLPSADGHDLRVVPDSRDLIVTSETSVHLFDRDKASFRPHPLLAESANLKSVDIHPTTKRIVVSDWGAVLHFRSPDGQIQLKTSRPYKARWLVE